MPENHPVEAVVKETVTKPCNFTELYHTIPNKISKHMAKNLSVPIAFVCLLHLANEKVWIRLSILELFTRDRLAQLTGLICVTKMFSF